MGLDIDKCRVIKPNEADEDDSRIVLTEKGAPARNNNKYLLMFAEKFKDYVTEADFEYYDFEKAFSDIGLNYENFQWISMSDQIVFKNIHDENDTIAFDENLFPTQTFKEKVIYYTDLEYQRKGMKLSFYKEILAGCWYITDDTELDDSESMDLVLTNEDLEKVKQHAEEESDILKWHLNDDEFIYFCY